MSLSDLDQGFLAPLLGAGGAALRPADPRDSARLLTVRGRDVGALGDFTFMDLPGQLRPGDVLVVNDTRVIPAQLFARLVRVGGDPWTYGTLHSPTLVFEGVSFSGA